MGEMRGPVCLIIGRDVEEGIRILGYFEGFGEVLEFWLIAL